MSCFRKMLYLSASVIILTQASETLANPDIGSLYPTLTLHSLELRPANSFQLARATFLPDTKDDLGFSGRDTGGTDINRGDPCKGYTLFTCPTHGTCKPCLVNNNKKQLVSCSSPYLVSGNSCVCPQTVSLTYANDKCTQYCDGKCIKKTCDKTPNQTGCTNGSKACDDGCGGTARQCCVPCTDKITSKPANSNYTYSTCTDEKGSRQIKTGWKCATGYHQSGNSCEKDCIVNNCSGYTLTACPTGKTCSKCTKTATNCSTDGTFYKEECTKTQTSCSTGYTLVNTCQRNSTTYGDCVNCRDETSPYNPCYGYYICEGDKQGSGTTCLCGNQTYYEKCLVKETCLYEYREDTSCASGIRYFSMTSTSTTYCHSKGTEITKSSNTCQRDGYTWYEKSNNCTSSKGSAAGKITCEYPGGEIRQCGGFLYGDYCLSECNYEDTPATCSAQGKNFTIKCQDEAGNQYGECS